MQTRSIPTSVDALTPEWLTDALQENGVLPGEVHVTGVTRSDPGNIRSSISHLALLKLTYSRAHPSLPEMMVAKMHALEPEIRDFAKIFYANEVRFYGDLVKRVSLPAPNCYLALATDDGSEALLLLEDLSSTRLLGEQTVECTEEQALAVTAHLGRFHGEWWNHPELVDSTTYLTHDANPDGLFWTVFSSSLNAFEARLGSNAAPSVVDFAHRVVTHQPVVQRLFASSPQSLLHGDFRISNLAFSQGRAGCHVCAMDWQLHGRGQALQDVAWFMLSSLSPEQRIRWEEAMLDAYHAALVSTGPESYSRTQLSSDLRVAMVGAIMFGFGAMSNVRFDDTDRLAVFLTLQERIEAVVADYDLRSLLSES